MLYCAPSRLLDLPFKVSARSFDLQTLTAVIYIIQNRINIMTQFDQLAAICFGFMLVPFLAYAIVVRLQYGYAESSNYRQTVLSTRAAFFLPGYALLMWLSVIAPKAFTGLGVIINLVEGYSFYTFFSLIIFNLGGTTETVDAMVKSGKEYFLCSFCFPVDNKAQFFRRNAWTMFHMLFTRVAFTIIGAIAFYSDTKAGKSVAIIIQVICAALVVTMIIHLVNLCKLYTELLTPTA